MTSVQTPTNAPISAPINNPVKPPTKSPMNAPVIGDPPVTSPVNGPIISSPMKAPQVPPTPAAYPNETPLRAPILVPVVPPAQPPKVVTKQPSKAPEVSPIPPTANSPAATKAPVLPPVQPPQKRPTKAPEFTSSGKWIEVKASSPIVARHEMCFHIIDTPGIGRRVYLVGGLGTKDLDIYNPFNRTWSKGKPVPITLHHVQCVVTQGKLWLVAAWMGGYPQEQNVNATYVYDPATNSWATKSALPVGRRRGSAAAMLSPDGTQIYVSHGNSGGHETANFATSQPYLDEYNIASDTWTALSSNAPNPRDHTGGAMVNGLICVAGGRNGGEINWPMVAPTDCFNLTSRKWEVKDPMPVILSGYCDGLRAVYKCQRGK
jgi:hypothetical protein